MTRRPWSAESQKNSCESNQESANVHALSPTRQLAWSRQPPEIQGTGYVVHSLEAALWVFHSSDSFQDAVLKAVNLGDDADTTGAVCGQLAGAYWSESGIPEKWLTKLAKREMIEQGIMQLTQ
jgi:ADP-ribosyl-[dinitrogen reductase] hydrolase